MPQTQRSEDVGTCESWQEVNKILLEYASLALDSETKGKVAEVEQFILMFEYEKAVEKINELF